MIPKLNEPEAGLLQSCAADWVGLWVVTGEAREWFAPTTAAELRENTRSLLEPLLSQRLIEAGEVDLTQGEFRAWGEQGEAALERVFQEWEELGHEPSIGDIAWFQATPAGERVAAALILGSPTA